MKKAKENNARLEKGTPTLIPFPDDLPSLKSILPGLIPSDTVGILGSTGIGKSRIARKLALKDIRAFCESKNIRLKVFINSLEEPVQKLVGTFVTQEFKVKFGEDIKYYDAINYKVNPASNEFMRRIEQCTNVVHNKYFKNNLLTIVRETNPYKFFKLVQEYLYSVGKFYYIKRNHKGQEVSREHITKLGKPFNHYEYNEPTIVVTIYDTIDKTQPYNDGNTSLSVYDAVGRYVHHYADIILGKVCGCINFVVSQQKSDNTVVETNFKGKTILEKLKPHLGAMRTNKSVGESFTLALAGFNPLQYGFTDYMDYTDLNKLTGGFLSLLVLKTREGVIAHPNNEIPLITNFGIDQFRELPKPGDPELKYFYE